MAWFTKNIVSWWGSLLEALWNDPTASWNSTTHHWDAYDGTWETKDKPTWYTKN